MKKLRYLDPIVVNWFFAELPSHRHQDYEKVHGKPLDNDTKDYIQDIIKYHFPEAEISIYQEKDPFDYMILVKTHHGIYISFAGTDGWKDWLCNAKLIPDKRGMHPGWRESVKRFYPILHNHRKMLDHCHIDISGHSQGGPLAGYAARHLLRNGIRSSVWTYESPVWGTDAFCMQLAGEGVSCTRSWVNGDPVVRWFQNIGRHFGNSNKLPDVIPLLRFFPVFRTYLHSYSVGTKALRKWCKKRNMKDEAVFLNSMLKRVTI